MGSQNKVLVVLLKIGAKDLRVYWELAPNGTENEGLIIKYACFTHILKGWQFHVC